MNCIIAHKDGTIFRFIRNAIRKGKKIEGEGKWGGKPELYDIVWTNQDLTPIYDDDGNVTGFAETLADIETVEPPRYLQKEKKTRQERLDLAAKMEDLAGLSFEQLNTYIDSNVADLAEAKTYLKRLSTVTLALIKLVEEDL